MRLRPRPMRQAKAVASAAAIAAVCALASGCRQRMADQPSLRPLEPAVLQGSAASARDPVAGTVARGHLHTDWALFTGRSVPGESASAMGAKETTSESKATTAATGALATGEVAIPTTGGLQAPVQAVIAAELANYRDVVDEFPIPITEQTIEHGRNRYMIYCVVCHDAAGTGHGKIVERGYTRPPSYHIDRLRTAPVGHLFRVITLGYGSMPSYASQIPARDRWAIVAYIRAMQLSQHFPVDQENQLPKEVREQLSEAKSPAATGGHGP